MSSVRLAPEREHTDVFTKHRGPVTCAVAVPRHNGSTKEIVSSGYDGAVAITDVTQQTMALVGYHDHLVNRIALSASGRFAASPSSDYTVGLWDLRGRRLVRFLRGHSDDVEDFVFVDDTTGISVSRDRRVIVWDLATGAIHKALVGHDKDVLSVAYADGQIFTSGDDMTLRVWDLATGELIRQWGPFEHETDTCAIDVQRDRVILGCDDGVIRIFEISSGRAAGEIPGHASGIKIVAVSPSTGHIFSAAYDRRLVIWDADSLAERLALQRVASAWERSFNWTPDGSKIIAGTFDGTIIGWDAGDGRQIFEVGGPGGNACLNEVASVDDLAAAVADDGYLRLGRLSETDASWIAHREPRAGRVLANAVTADRAAGVIVAGFHDQTVRIFTLDDTLRETHALNLQEGPINSVKVLSVNGDYHIFAACYSGRVVRLTTSGEMLAKLRVHDGAVKSLCLIPSRDLGISCSADGSTYSWSLETGERQMVFPAHTAIVNDLDVDLAGSRVATVGRDFVLNVYSLDSGRLLQAFPLAQRSPKAVAFATNDIVMIGDYWGNIIRVPLVNGTISRRRIAENGISSLARRNLGKILASSYDGAIFLVDVATIEVVNDLRAMRQRIAPPMIASIEALL
jgi:WD40 repeat protein